MANNSTKTSSGWRHQLRDYVVIVLGMAVYAFGFTVFILPHGIVIGGMAGFSTLVYYATAETIPVAVTMYGVNLLLLLFGARELGKGFALRTIFGATVMSLMIGALEGYFTSHPPLISSMPMSILLGSVLLGFGIGLYYSHHGTAGGTDIVAAIMANRTNISVGRVMMIVDFSIVALSFFLPFDGDMEARVQTRTQSILYGWLAIFIYSWLTDRYLQEGRRTVQFIILSDKWREIAHRVTHETGRGVTTWDAQGFWTGDSKKLLMIWCRKVDTFAIFSIVKEVDEEAYITDSFVRGVYGNGFDSLSPHKKKKAKD